jgi:dUTP pyrophosphatase
MSSQGEVYLRFVKMSGDALPPERTTPRSAGFDLRSPRNAVIPARGKSLILTDLRIQVPEGYYGRIAARSGLAFFHHITTEAGVIDEDYRGNIGVLLLSHSNYQYLVHRGDKIAQLICEKIVILN